MYIDRMLTPKLGTRIPIARWRPQSNVEKRESAATGFAKMNGLGMKLKSTTIEKKRLMTSISR